MQTIKTKPELIRRVCGGDVILKRTEESWLWQAAQGSWMAAASGSFINMLHKQHLEKAVTPTLLSINSRPTVQMARWLEVNETCP